jgi:hypothetical protein
VYEYLSALDVRLEMDRRIDFGRGQTGGEGEGWFGVAWHGGQAFALSMRGAACRRGCTGSGTWEGHLSASVSAVDGRGARTGRGDVSCR